MIYDNAIIMESVLSFFMKIPKPLFRARRNALLLFIGTLGLITLLAHTTHRSAIHSEQGYFSRSTRLAKSDEPDPQRNAGKHAAFRDGSTHCTSFPNVSNILLIMKTGASEAYAKIPTQLMTNLKCVPHYLIFSDMAQSIAGHEIHDSLNTVLPDTIVNNADFDLYYQQKQCLVGQEECNKGKPIGPAAWALDKYKNIHIAEKAYARRPKHDWYLFVDADSYVVWPTLAEFLANIDPSQQHYLGSAASWRGQPFAHGGSGYLISQGAMHAMFHGKIGVANKFDVVARSTCCGDALFAEALWAETGVVVNNMWPSINGEQPHTLAFWEWQWCQPIMTMHHVASQMVSEYDEFEKERNFSSPIRIKDLFHRFVEDQLSTTRNDWNNFSNDVYYVNKTVASEGSWDSRKTKAEGLSELEKAAYLSPGHCRAACLSLTNCLQYLHRQGICAMSSKIKHGQPAKTRRGSTEDQWTSGWDLERIETWVREHDDCGEVVWPEV